MLLTDYTDLVNHSKELSRFGVTAEAFNSHFEEGLNASLTFLASSGISKAKVKNLIVKNFYDNPSLPHQIERPHLTKINLPLALRSLRQFSGAWYGNWKEIRVNHYWLPVRQTTKTISDQVTLLGFQSCFTGDGYGWNYVVKQNNHILILGFVVHLDDHGKITAKNPHYAFLNNKKQLIWVSEDHIYYEFICRHDTANKRHYVISGAGYEKQFGKLTLAGGFQTIYSSNNEDLPAFKNINLKQSKS